MAGFRTIYNTFPGLNILSQIEGISVVDIAPPADPLGAGTGTVCVVAEFEDGAFNAPQAVSGGTDLAEKFGGFGYTYDGQPSQLPCAVRSAQSASYWNGSGFINLRNKRFSSLILCRVDNSAGSVQINRRASLVGGAPSFSLTPASTIRLSLNGGALVTGTFTGTQAVITGSGGTYPTGFVGGEYLGLRIGDAPEVLVAFQAGDQAVEQARDRINNTLALTVASVSGGELILTAPQYGYDSSIEISSGNTQAILGLPVAAVAHEWAITVTNSSAGDYEVAVVVTVDGVATTYTAEYTLLGTETLTEHRDTLLNTLLALGPAGVSMVATGAAQITVAGEAGANATIAIASPPAAEPVVGDVTAAETVPAVYTKVNGTGVAADLDFASFAEVSGVLTPLGVVCDLDQDGNLRVSNPSASLTSSLQVDAGSTAAAALGLTVGVVVTAANGVASTIAAGTRLRDATSEAVWVTVEDVEVPAVLTSTLSAKVRPGIDDDTAPTVAIGDLSTVIDSLPDSFGVTNAAAISRLSAAQMDARYLAAIESTIDVSGVSYDINVIAAARSTETIMRALRSNALEASASGHRARKTMVAPPIGTTRAVAQGSSGVGVGSVGRSERVVYNFPGMTTLIPEISAIGVAGGPGFTDSGIVQVRSDLFYASVASILAPEENKGQELSTSNYGPMNALGLEYAYDRAQGGLGLTKTDYINFKNAGICAPRFDRTAGMVFQSDVTSVSPVTAPALVDAKRRFVGDFVIDTVGDISVSYVKKLGLAIRRRALQTAITSFLETLLSRDQPEQARIAGYDVINDTTAAQADAGFVILTIKVKTLASMDFIVLRTTVGTTVEVTQTA